MPDNAFNEKINNVIHDNEFVKNLDKRALDMYLISQCNHHIVIPSSFNWWGAWLSESPNKKVIAPKKWFGPPLDQKNDTKDLYCSDWITL